MELLKMSRKQLMEYRKYILNYNKIYNDKIDLNENIKFGCEVEFVSKKSLDYYNKKINNSNYNVEHDCSGINIVEVITPILNNSINDWNTFKNIMNSLDGKITNKVGGHIHFDHSIVGDNNLINLIKFWYCFEDIIYEYSKGEFNELRDSYKLYAGKFDMSVCDLISRYDKGFINIDYFRILNKEYGINLSNHLFFKNIFNDFKDTYEIRVPNSSLDIITWQNNVEFFGNLLKFCKNNDLIINEIYKKGKVENTIENVMLLSDLIYSDIDSKTRFLNQFYGKKKNFDKETKIFFK